MIVVAVGATDPTINKTAARTVGSEEGDTYFPSMKYAILLRFTERTIG